MKSADGRVVLVCGAVLALTSACSKSERVGGSRPAEAARPVRTAMAEVRPMERWIAVAGSLVADEEATLSVKVPGRLRTLSVDIGSAVKQGEAVAQVEPRDYELRLQQATAALAQARATVGLPLTGDDDAFDPETTSAVKEAKAHLDEAEKNRQRAISLSQVGISPASELDTAEAAYGVALNRFQTAREESRTRQALLAQRRAEWELAKQQLTDTSVRVPFDGVVQARVAHRGEFLPGGSPVLRLVKTDPLRLRLLVPERESLAVRAGQRVRLTVEGDTNGYAGTIARVSPAIDEAARTLAVEADVRNPGSLRPGLFARAQIVTDESDAVLAVPASALTVFAGLEKVVIAREGKAEERPITTGRRAADWVEVVTGLRVGDAVVLDPGNLRTGQPVAVMGGSAPWQTTQARRDEPEAK